jgi:isopenicillin-N epimerase
MPDSPSQSTDEQTHELAEHWSLDRAVAYLNHGSFGACPKEVLHAQWLLRRRLEAEPVRFFEREYSEFLARARQALADFLDANAEAIGFVPNATHGVNTVLRSLDFQPGDQLLVTDHEYRAVHNALVFAAARAGAEVVVAEIPFPIAGPEVVVEAVLAAVTPRTRLAVIDHITSPTGLVFPIERLVAELDERGIDTLVDGAHGPGMVFIDLDAMAPAYYAGNCHKWLCAPKGAAFLYVRPDRQRLVRPLSISHGASQPLRVGQTRYRLEFDWTGTHDPTAYMCIPEALNTLRGLAPGGWPEIRERNRSLVLAARRLLCETLGIDPPCPEEMIGSMAAVPLPDSGAEADADTLARLVDPLQDRLFDEHRIEVPVIPWPAPPKRVLRLSAQLYNRFEQYEQLATVLSELLD